jgi:uncharacterized membrane protein
MLLLLKNYILAEPCRFMRSQIVKKISLLLMHFFVCAIALGQDLPPPQPENTIPPPFGLPIDNSILLLVVLGLFLGIFFSASKEKAKL